MEARDTTKEFIMRAAMLSIFMVMSVLMFGNMSESFDVIGADSNVQKMETSTIPSTEAAQYTKAFTSIAEKFGLWAALTVLLVIATVVMGWFREKRMAKRIDELEEARTKTASEVASALTKNGELLEDVVETGKQQLVEMQKLSTELRCRPCIKQ